MPTNSNTLNKKLYDLLKTRGYKPQPKDSSGKTIPLPDEADVFKFDFKTESGEVLDSAWITIEDGNTLKVYYDDDVMALSETENDTNEFTNFLIQLKNWAQGRQLGFELENEDHLASDMAKRDYMKKENILEGYYPMGKSASYNDNIPTIKIVLQHTRQIQEGEQRYRNVARIYLENAQGERILAPTVRPGIAQVYARHLAEGGVPNDERWNHIKSLCEEYSKMAGFVRAVRGNQFNESAQRLVEAGLNHYQSLRESLGKMRGHRGYTAYFESWTPTLMETEGEESSLNELFVQETLDPRIESVMPILSKLKVDLSEMKEVSELAEWADSLTEAPGAETLAHNEKTEKQRMRAFDLEENDDADLAQRKIQTPAFQRKATGQPDWKTTTQDLAKAKERHISGPEGLSALTKRLQSTGQLEEEEVEESGLQAYLGNKKYGKEGMDALRKAGREHASKEKMAKIRAKYDKLDEAADNVDERATENTAYRFVDMLANTDVGRAARNLMHQGKLGKRQNNYVTITPQGTAQFSIPFQVMGSDDKAVANNSNYKSLNNLFMQLIWPKRQKEGWFVSQPRTTQQGGVDEQGFTTHTFDFTMYKPDGGQGVTEGQAPEIDPQTSFSYAMKMVQGLNDHFGGKYFEHQLNKDGSITIVKKAPWADEVYRKMGRGDPSQNPDFQQPGVLTGKNFNRVVNPWYNIFRQKGWRFDQPVNGEFTIAVNKQQGVAEDLDANQKRAKQLGPTTPVGKNEKNLRGMAVGASESFINTDAQAVVTEMDKSQPSSDRGGESSGNPYAKGGKATPIKAAKAKKDFLGVLQKSVDKHNKAKQATDEKVKKHMKEGQDDLDFIKGVISKNTLKEDANQVKFLGYNGSSYPLQKAFAEKAFRMGTLRSMKMDNNGRPYAIINDPESMGDYKAYWNDSVGAWTIDFD